MRVTYGATTKIPVKCESDKSYSYNLFNKKSLFFHFSPGFFFAGLLPFSLLSSNTSSDPKAVLYFCVHYRKLDPLEINLGRVFLSRHVGYNIWNWYSLTVDSKIICYRLGILHKVWIILWRLVYALADICLWSLITDEHRDRRLSLIDCVESYIHTHLCWTFYSNVYYLVNKQSFVSWQKL